jgi:hypothetical protein
MTVRSAVAMRRSLGSARRYQAWVVPQRGQPTVVETEARNECPQPQRYSARSSGPPERLARAWEWRTDARGPPLRDWLAREGSVLVVAGAIFE